MNPTPETTLPPPAASPPELSASPLPKRRSRIRRVQPVLRFTPAAWAKLQFFCHVGETEIGGFGVAPTNDLLRIEEFVTVRQTTSAVSVAFDDHAVAEFFDAQVDAGRRPEQFGRIWLHTHPGDSPTPSGLDEDTFGRVFGGCQWAVMFILARGGDTYARLRFNVGPGGALLIPVEVDYHQPFPASDHAAWVAEYERNIRPRPEPRPVSREPGFREDAFERSHDPFGSMDAMEQELFQEAYEPWAWDEEEIWA